MVSLPVSDLLNRLSDLLGRESGFLSGPSGLADEGPDVAHLGSRFTPKDCSCLAHAFDERVE